MAYWLLYILCVTDRETDICNFEFFEGCVRVCHAYTYKWKLFPQILFPSHQGWEGERGESSIFSNFSLEPNKSIGVGKGVGSEGEAMIELPCSRHFLTYHRKILLYL